MPGADPSTGTIRDALQSLLNARCAFVNAMSYRAEIFMIEPYGTESKEETGGLAHAYAMLIECDLSGLDGSRALEDY
jgi:hypothetical protein